MARKRAEVSVEAEEPKLKSFSAYSGDIDLIFAKIKALLERDGKFVPKLDELAALGAGLEEAAKGAKATA